MTNYAVWGPAVHRRICPSCDTPRPTYTDEPSRLTTHPGVDGTECAMSGEVIADRPRNRKVRR